MNDYTNDDTDYILGEDVTWLFRRQPAGLTITISVADQPPLILGRPQTTTSAASAVTVVMK